MPLYLDSRTVKEPLDTIFLGVQSNGRSLFTADVSGSGEEEDTLKLLNLTGEQARFFQLREFRGSRPGTA